MMRVLLILLCKESTVVALRFAFPAQDNNKSPNPPLSAKPTNSIDLMTRLWDGEDVNMPQEALLASLEFANISRVMKETGRRIQILGGFDSGTNLVTKLLETNLGTTGFRSLCPGLPDQQGRTDQAANDGHCFVWKHTAPWKVEESLKSRGLDLKDVVMVVAVRSPLAHISGWLKAPYDFKNCVDTLGTMNHKLQSADCMLNPQQNGANLTNMGTLEHAWNAYMHGYNQLKSQGANMIIVEYENLVMNTDSTMQRIFRAFDIDVKDAKQYLGPAKDHGSPVGHAKAVEKILHSTYMNKKPFNDVTLARGTCSQLDIDMMQSHSFLVPAQDGRTQSHDYSKDCSDLMA